MILQDLQRMAHKMHTRFWKIADLAQKQQFQVHS